MEKKVVRSMIAVLMAFLMVFAMAACGNKKEAAPEKEPEKQEQTEPDYKALLQQVAEDQLKPQYKDYMPDEVFADWELFGVDMDGTKGTAYAFLYTSEYVELKEKLYEMSGSAGEVIITFDTADGTKLEKVTWSADGSEHDKWLEENYPEEYLKKAKEYQLMDEKGNYPLADSVQKMGSEKMGYPVETDNLLNIDLEKETYEIVKTKESGDPEKGDYKFDTETIETGKLKDLK